MNLRHLRDEDYEYLVDSVDYEDLDVSRETTDTIVRQAFRAYIEYNDVADSPFDDLDYLDDEDRTDYEEGWDPYEDPANTGPDPYEEEVPF